MSEAASREIKIAVIPGDGIGQEVVPGGDQVLDRLAELSDGRFSFAYEEFPWGCQYYQQTGRMIDEAALQTLQAVRRDLLRGGRLAGRARPYQPVGPAAGDLPGLRPVRQHPPGPAAAGRREPAAERDAARRSTGSWCARTARASTPASAGGTCPGAGAGKEIAIQAGLFTEEGCERVIRYAFNLALTRKRQKVTSVTKSNAQQYGMVLWDEVFRRVSQEFPGVETEQWLVDAMAARFVLRPDTLEVVVASNLFADILSDLGSALAGSLGIAASANLNPTAASRACSSRSTARRPTSPARGSPTRSRRSGARR